MFDESRALHGILQTASLKPKAEAAARFQPISKPMLEKLCRIETSEHALDPVYRVCFLDM